MSQFIEMFGTPENNHNDYPVIKIGEMVESINYGTSKPATDNGKYVYLRMNNITYDGKLDLSEVKRINLSPEEDDSAFVHKGDLMFNRTNTKEFVGKTTVFNLDEQMVVAGYIIRVRFKEKYSPEYVSGYLNSTYGKALLRKMAKGAVHQANINAQEFQGIQVLDVPKQEQDKYVTIAQQADKSGFDGHKSQFIEMFKGDFPKLSWEECLTIINGKKYDDDYQESGTYPICGSGGIMGYGERMLCPKDTVILGRKGNINSPIYMETDYWIVDTAFCLDVDRTKLHPKYFYFWCKLFDFTRYNKQGVLPSLTKNDLLKIEMPIPPMELQTKFVDIIEQSDKSGSVLQYRIAC